MSASTINDRQTGKSLVQSEYKRFQLWKYLTQPENPIKYLHPKPVHLLASYAYRCICRGIKYG